MLVRVLLFAMFVFWAVSMPPILGAPSAQPDKGDSKMKRHNTSATVEAEKELCLACHESLPKDIKDPVYLKCSLYEHCEVCHGKETARGNGVAAPFLYPKPRNMESGIFKLRSTGFSDSPTLDDVYHVIGRGIPGSAMPGFAFMTEVERRALTDHVKTLGSVSGGSRRQVPGRPPFTEALVDEGDKVYHQAGCTACHGEHGDGDGPSALALRDFWGNPIFPNRLTQGVYKGGRFPEELYLRITCGVSGTPMQAWEELTTPQQRWALVAYILDKLAKNTPEPKNRLLIPARRTAGEVPTTPDASTWQEAEEVGVSLSPLWQKTPSLLFASVRAVHNGREIAIRMEWICTVPVRNVSRHQDFPDACALEFPMYDGSFAQLQKTSPKKVGSLIPSFVMGDRGRPVDIWYWSAGGSSSDPRARAEDAPADAIASLDSSGFLTGQAVRNPVSLKEGGVVNLTAEGIGTTSPVPVEMQALQGTASWKEGKWKVVFRRSFKPSFARGARFAVGERIPIAFAIWQGIRGERDGHKAVAGWRFLELEK